MTSVSDGGMNPPVTASPLTATGNIAKFSSIWVATLSLVALRNEKTAMLIAISAKVT